MAEDHSKAQNFAVGLLKDYAGLIEEVDGIVPKSTRDELYAEWVAELANAGYQPNGSAKVIALATLLPILESLENVEAEDQLTTFQVWFMTLVENLRKQA